MTPTSRGAVQHLIFDADDTLWENNFHFERAIEDFRNFLDHSTLTCEEVRAVLDEVELANLGKGGRHGVRAFFVYGSLLRYSDPRKGNQPVSCARIRERKRPVG